MASSEQRVGSAVRTISAQPAESPAEPIVTVEAVPVPAVSAPIMPSAASPCVPDAARGTHLPWLRNTDTLAVASAVCGLTAFVPVVSQVMGLVLGIVSLLRIRRARLRGVHLRGKPWALAGIFSSGFVLLSWIAVLALLIAARISFLHAADALRAVASPGG